MTGDATAPAAIGVPGDGPLGLISCCCSLESDAGPSVGRQRELRDLYAIENYASWQLTHILATVRKNMWGKKNNRRRKNKN